MKYFGILNITPDSFSDGNKFLEKEKAIARAKVLAKTCDVIDIGGVSTRPNAPKVSVEEENIRLGTMIEEVSKFAKVSIDSFNFQTQQEAIKQGASFVNDVTAFSDEQILTQAPKNVRFVFMHHLTVPSNKNVIMQTRGGEMLNEILNWAGEKIERYKTLGIEKERLIFDVGTGFGKDFEQNITIFENIKIFHQLGVEIMIGHSRKSFIEEIKPQATLKEKDEITYFITQEMKENGVQWARVHEPYDLP